MLHIPIQRVVALIELKTDYTKEEIEQKISEKLTEFSGLLSKEGAAHIIANELGVDLEDAKKEPLTISELKEGMQSIRVAAKVISKYDMNTFERNGTPGRVQSLYVGDQSGRTRVTFWHDDVSLLENIKEDDTLLLANMAVRKNQGKLELHATKNTQIQQNPQGVTVVVAQQSQEQQIIEHDQLKINQIDKETQGANLFGVVVQVMNPYFFPIDKTTRRKVTINDQTPFDETVHEWNMVCNCVLDDGSETLRIACFGEHVANLLQLSESEVLELKDNSERFSEVQNQLLGCYARIGGKVNYNEQYDRIEMIAQSVNTNPNVEEELKVLKSS